MESIESRFLKDYDKALENNVILTKELANVKLNLELLKQEEALPLEDKNVKQYSVSESGGEYYSIHVAGDYYYERILKANKKDLDYLKQCLQNITKFNKFLKMDSGDHDYVGKVTLSRYDLIVKYGTTVSLGIYNAGYIQKSKMYWHQINDEQNFMSERKATAFVKAKVLKQIKTYIESETKKAKASMEVVKNG